MKKVKFNLTIWIVIASVLGGIIGFFISEPISFLKPFGDLFTRLLFMVVPALVFFSIASSFANIGNMRKLSKWGGKIIGWFLMSTIFAAIIGTITGLIFKPGKGLKIEDAGYEATEITANTFIEWIPGNAFESLSTGNIIQIVIFSMIAGMAVVLMKSEKEKTFLVNLFNSGQALFLTITKYVMYYAPFGIFALMVNSVYQFKGGLLEEMSSFLAAFTISFIIQVVVVYFLLFWIITKLNPFTFTKKISSALLTACGTVSSAGTMPVTLEAAKNVGIKKDLRDFGIPLGVTFNMDSMALQIPMYIMLGMFTVGHQPTFFELITFVLLGIVFSIGTAGVPGGGLAVAIILVNAFGLPVDVVAWVAAVFIYLDITGTAMNVWGDLVSTTIAAKTEGQLDEDHFHAKLTETESDQVAF